jgi:hypothetical protein
MDRFALAPDFIAGIVKFGVYRPLYGELSQSPKLPTTPFCLQQRASFGEAG